MRLADYVWKYFADKGVDHVFLVTGGTAMHLNDGLLSEPRISVVCVHHEQAGAMAAEGYARVNHRPAVVSTIAGPGAINALTGLYGAYVDSIPVICIAGQSKRQLLREYALEREFRGTRQLGIQEADSARMAEPATKFSATVMEPSMIRWYLDQAWLHATSGRPGPVFLDIPLDVQAAEVNPDTLVGFQVLAGGTRSPQARLAAVRALLASAERPVLVAGEGVREGQAEDIFVKVAEALRIPVLTAWAPDLYPPNQPFYAGRLGTLGTRAGNFAAQTCDLLLVVGSRLTPPQVTFNWENFAKNGVVVSVNVDPLELHKPIYAADHHICAEPREFLTDLLATLPLTPKRKETWDRWLLWCRGLVERYPEVTEDMRTFSPRGIHPYHFVDELFRRLEDDAFVACGDAAAGCVPLQAAPLRSGQRVTSNASCGSMGHDLPSAIGAAFARKGKRVVCLAGDGSIMLNIQELQTVAHHKLPLGIFVLCNGGYQSIRATQSAFFGRFVGEGEGSGLSFPDYAAVARAFGLEGFYLRNTDEDGREVNWSSRLTEILETPGPWLCSVYLDPTVGLQPRVLSRINPDGSMSTASLEDMYPFLDPEEVASVMKGPC